MYTRIFTTLLLAAILSLPAFATIRYCDSNTNNTLTGVFRTVQAAHDASNNGDTIYVAGNFDTLRHTKRLTWVGTGYNLSNTTNTQVSLIGANITTTVLEPGSENSMFVGIRFYASYWALTVNCSNVTIRRCAFEIYSGANSSLRVGRNISNVIIEQCFNIYGGTSIDSGSTGIILRNNIFSSEFRFLSSNPGLNLVYNNTFRGNLFLNSSVEFYNNVVDQPSSYSVLSGANTYNNVCTSATLLTGNGNVSGVAPTSLFVNSSYGGSDSDLRLAVGSPARSVGVGGVDCGAFGGPTPYVISGVPAIPSISAVSAPSVGTPTSGLSITIQATAHP